MLAEAQQFVNWLRRTNPQSHTWKDYRSDLLVFSQSTGDRPIGQISVQDVDSFIQQQCQKGFTPKTINRRLTAISALYTYFSEQDESLVCPVIKGRHQLREPKRLPRPVPLEDLRRFFAVVDDPRDRAMFVLMLRCGLRVGEVAALHINDLILKDDQPRMLVNGKASKQRIVYLSNQAQQVLKAYLAVRPRCPDEHVFLSYQLKGLSTHAIQMRLEHYRSEAGLNFTCHQLRHCFGSDLNEADMPLTSIQTLMGHESIETTMKYVQINDKKVQADFEAASQKLEGWSA
jgi:site-specific recombinase XerD